MEKNTTDDQRSSEQSQKVGVMLWRLNVEILKPIRTLNQRRI